MYKEIAYNKRITWLILFLFCLLLVFVGYVFGKISDLGYGGVFLGLLIALPSALIGYYSADSVVLFLAGAQPVAKKDNPVLYNTVENLAITAGLPAPKIYVIQDNSMNAFATGRDPGHAVVAITSGLLAVLSKTELEGVLAHEFSHIRNFDTRLSMILVVFVGLISILADSVWRFGFGGRNSRKRGGELLFVLGLILIIFSPIVAKLLQLALSRNREFLADADAALLTRYPEGLASALEKLSSQEGMLKRNSNILNHLYIVSPLDNQEGKSKKNWLAGWFSTHPPIQERIKKLRVMNL